MSSNIIGPLPNKSDASSEKVKILRGPLPNKSDSPSEEVKKSSGYLDDIRKPMVTTIDMVDKEGTIDTVDKKVN